MGYTRIERVTGGTARSAIPEYDSGLIDEVTYGTREQCPVVENGQRSGNPPTPRARNVEKLTEMGKKERKRSAKVLLFAYMLAYMK